SCSCALPAALLRPLRRTRRAARCAEPALEPTAPERGLLGGDLRGRPVDAAGGRLAGGERHVDRGHVVLSELDVADAPPVVGARRLTLASLGDDLVGDDARLALGEDPR